ncbi:RING-H2 finger protein ATL74-like [Phragmites australis]|uniref:RING-H2 finger protein ATL74-like n=1 Tax=Phragmites australis TaxID=29695 RepID=UPI002D774089|nr:RING-H2 finger protein ATL74-like [Phragmites australis]
MRRLSDNPTADDASTAPLLVTPASASAARGGALLPPAGGSSASFDANMIIILAALLCILICALGLNSLVRFALHCGRTLTVAAPPAAAAAAVAAPATGAGLKKRDLRKIPVQVYEAKASVPGTECAICLGEFADGEKVRVLPRCHHGFHMRCIDIWFAEHSSCPICRISFLDEGGAGEATVAGERT